MVVSPHQLVASVTHRVPLSEGDIILTGTPPGIAFDRNEGWLQAGDQIVATISGLDDLVTFVVPE